MKTVCETDKCTGCTACVNICPHNAISIQDTMISLNAVIDKDKCVNCDACEKICHVNHPVAKLEPMKWYQGWSADSVIRSSSSSGGIAAAIEKAFVSNGGYVCSCIYSKGEFVYSTTNRPEDVKKFKGSKYVKSDPAGVYKEIKTLLCQGSKVLFVGLPCHAAAVRKYIGEKYADNLFVADLICHGSPSQKLLKLFLEQHNKSFDSIQNIEFRNNNKYCLSLNDKYICHKDCLDKYSMGFLNALFFTENCYECKYASKKRISDITLGDSWGSSMSAEEQKRGISLILVQTEKGLQLLKDSNVELFDVDVEKAVSNNHQLRHPSAKTEKREYFFAGLKKKKKFDSLVRKCYPKSSFKQWIKGILIKLHIK